MDIRQKKVLLLGGWGLVGTAVLHKLNEYKPNTVIILSLLESEARDACDAMGKLYPNVEFIPEWGNIFVRESLKDLSRTSLLEQGETRQQLLVDNLETFTDDILEHSFLHQVISKHKPHIIIDSINTSTALAYQDVYDSYFNLKTSIQDENGPIQKADVEKLLTTLYIPQIIRHIQILHQSMVNNKTGVYIKIGTTGTGGMGLNIPYTHSEEKPSRVLLSKSSLAGAHTMLLFLMGRTPGGPICKEVKPAAAIAWKSIGHDEIKKYGSPIRLYDCPPNQAETISSKFQKSGSQNWVDLNENLKSVYIDTGENGIFSSGEFETITAVGQMEFVTPEEIAENVILEILGDSTGHDIINGLDNSIMGPTYRAGYMRHQAMEQLEKLKQVHESESVAFEILGPPRLSKLLYEAHLLNKICGDIRCITTKDPQELQEKAEQFVKENEKFRSHALSIGIPILMGDGKTFLRGPDVKIPTKHESDSMDVTQDQLNQWANGGWIDLRINNLIRWSDRVEQIIDWVESLPKQDTSSQYVHGSQYWNLDQPLNIGKVVAWIFMNEDQGIRFKR